MADSTRFARPGGADLFFAGVAFVTGVLCVVDQEFRSVAVAAIALALLPWLLVVVGLRLPDELFAFMTMLASVAVALCTGISSGLFLAVAAASRVATRTDHRLLVAVTTAAVVGVPFLALTVEREWDPGAIYFALGGIFGVVIGVLLRRSARLADELRTAHHELTAAATREERHRIARDVHDLVAHSLTVVVLHVGGARRVLRTDPKAAEAALDAAERTSRESLDAIRGVVGLLRDERPPGSLTADLDGLIATYRGAGQLVSVRMDGDPADAPLPVRLTLYRVIQEALANCARHSPGSAVEIELVVTRTAAQVRIVNEHAGVPVMGTGGFGLVGLREQADSLGGELASGPQEGRWIVDCRLPIGSAG